MSDDAYVNIEGTVAEYDQEQAQAIERLRQGGGFFLVVLNKDETVDYYAAISDDTGAFTYAFMHGVAALALELAEKAVDR